MCASSIQVYATRILHLRIGTRTRTCAENGSWEAGSGEAKEGRKEGKEKRGGEGARVGGRSLNIKVGTDPSHV